jgi:hypothetical protein
MRCQSRMSSLTRGCALLPLTLVVGCNSGKSPGGGGPTWWLEAQKASMSRGLYRIPLGDASVAVAELSADQPQFACSDLAGGPDGGDLWSLMITLGVPASGTTANVGGTSASATSSLASVAVHHQEPTQAVGWTTYAVSGQLTLTSFPSTPSAVSTPMAGHVTALFLDNPTSTIDCQSGMESLPDGGLLLVPGACECQDSDGGTFSCTLPASATKLPSCCDAGIATVAGYQLTFDFDATGCSGL